MKFVLISHHRSGSTMLMHMLSQFPGFIMHDELFVMGGSYKPSTLREWLRVPEEVYLTAYLSKMQDQNGLIRNYLDRIYFPSSEGKTVGFKIMYNQILSFGYLFDYIKERNIRIIHLIRNNVIKGVLSAKYRRYPRGSVYDPSDALRKNMGLEEGEVIERFTINPEELLPFFRKREAYISQFKERLPSFPHYLELIYEDITNNGENIAYLEEKYVKKILEFLDIDAARTRKIVAYERKKAPPKISQYIENYPELVSYIKKEAPEYTKFLD